MKAIEWKSGQRVFFAERGKIFTGYLYSGAWVSSKLGEFEVPQNLNALDGTLRAFVETEAKKYGLVVLPVKNAPHAFDLAEEEKVPQL